MSKITKRKYVEQEVLEFVLPSDNQKIVKLTAGRGNNLHAVVDAEGKEFLVSMPNKFRKNIWVKRGDFVIIDPIEEGDKVQGEIVRVLFQEHIRHIQEEGLWPAAFGVEERKSTQYVSDDLLPPSDSDDDDFSSTKVVNANRGQHLYEQSDDDEDDSEDDEEGEDGVENEGGEESVVTEQQSVSSDQS